MNAKSTTSRIAQTMFCAGALSFAMAPSAMADEPPVAESTATPVGEVPEVSPDPEPVAGATTANEEAPAPSGAAASGTDVAEGSTAAESGSATTRAATEDADPAADAATSWEASTTEPVTFPMPAPERGSSQQVLVTGVGDSGWKKTVPDFGHGTDGAFSVQFTDREVVFSDPDAYVDMGLYKTGLNLGIAEVSESQIEGQDAHLRLIGAMGRWGQTPVEVTFEPGSPTAVLRIGDGRDAVSTAGLTPEQLRARQDLANVRFTSAEVGYKNTAEPTGHTATVRSVTIGGTTYTFHARREMVYVGQAGQAGWNTVRPSVVGTPGNPADYASTATFNGQGVVFSDPDARVWMGLRKTGLNVDLPTAATVELTAMNDAHLRLTGRGPSGNVELTFGSGPDSSVIVRVGTGSSAVTTTQTREQLLANPQLQGATFTSAEVGYKNTAEPPAGREVWVGAVTIGNTDYVFHADPTVTFRSDEELVQGPTPQPTPQRPMPPFTVTYSLPMTPMTPANTVSRPVEAPQAPAEKPAEDAQVEGAEDVAQSAAGTRDSSEQLAHTGAEEIAALAALALALVGTGITMVGVSRRRTA